MSLKSIHAGNTAPTHRTHTARRVAASLISACLLPIFATGAFPEDNLPALIKRVQASVVTILTYDKNHQPLAQGTGFFVDTRGTVITNYHVIKGAYYNKAQLPDGSILPAKEITGRDTIGDLVCITFDTATTVVEPLQFSKTVPQVGKKVVIIGSPLGLSQTVSEGIVSAVRDVPSFGNIIQTTAAISPGSSGSPLLNMHGQVIGIAVAHVVEGQNLNFAVPSQRVTALLPRITASKTPEPSEQEPKTTASLETEREPAQPETSGERSGETNAQLSDGAIGSGIGPLQVRLSDLRINPQKYGWQTLSFVGTIDGIVPNAEGVTLIFRGLEGDKVFVRASGALGNVEPGARVQVTVRVPQNSGYVASLELVRWSVVPPPPPRSNDNENTPSTETQHVKPRDTPIVPICPKGQSEQRLVMEIYRVRTGDTLESVAQRFGVSIETIIQKNGLRSDVSLRPGQSLIIYHPESSNATNNGTASGIASGKSTQRKVVGQLGVTNRDGVKIRQSPSPTGHVVWTAVKNTQLIVVIHQQHWYGVLMIDESTCWVPRKDVLLKNAVLVK